MELMSKNLNSSLVHDYGEQLSLNVVWKTVFIDSASWLS